VLDPENYGARVWYRFITRGSWPYICSPKPTLISLLPVICYRIREYGAGLGTGSVSGSDMLHFVRANLEFVNTVVDPDFKFAVKFSPFFYLSWVWRRRLPDLSAAGVVCHPPTVVLHAPAPVPPVHRAEGSASPSGTAACTKRTNNKLLGSSRKNCLGWLVKGSDRELSLDICVRSYRSCMDVHVAGSGLY